MSDLLPRMAACSNSTSFLSQQQHTISSSAHSSAQVSHSGRLPLLPMPAFLAFCQKMLDGSRPSGRTCAVCRVAAARRACPAALTELYRMPAACTASSPDPSRAPATMEASIISTVAQRILTLLLLVCWPQRTTASAGTLLLPPPACARRLPAPAPATPQGRCAALLEVETVVWTR